MHPREDVPRRRCPEEEAIERAKTGDVNGYETLYHLHKGRVYSWCLRVTGNPSDAEDLTQEAFLQLFRKISTFRGDSNFTTWLYRMTLNINLMHLRKRRISGVPLEVSKEYLEQTTASLHSPHCAVLFSVERLSIGRALGCLSEHQRAVFVLHDIQGLTHGEVARSLGVTIVNSKSYLHRARLELRHRLRPTNHPPDEDVS
jgi:RNA polymerase sigma-70 factor, ECF subfamily